MFTFYCAKNDVMVMVTSDPPTNKVVKVDGTERVEQLGNDV